MAREVGEAAAVEAGAEAVVVAEAVTIRWRGMWEEAAAVTARAEARRWRRRW